VCTAGEKVGLPADDSTGQMSGTSADGAFGAKGTRVDGARLESPLLITTTKKSPPNPRSGL
jgi:hypothetical protein